MLIQRQERMSLCLAFAALTVLLSCSEAAPTHTFDYVVIGAGAAGSLLAAKLAQAPEKYTVLLLEAGPRTDVPGPVLSADELKFFSVPALWGQSCAFNGEPDCPTDWGLRSETGPNEAIKALWFGKSTGGSSAQNAMQYIKGARADFRLWSSFGPEYAALWSPDRAARAFREIEGAVPALRTLSPDTYGTNGPIAVSAPLYAQPGFKDWYAAAWAAAGLPRAPDQNGPGTALGARLGLAADKFTITAGGRRSYAYEELVVPLLRRGAARNFKLVTGATATRIAFGAGGGDGAPVATEVAFVWGKREVTVGVGREVVVCAGAALSPAVLLRSGVGPAADLEAVGVPVVADNPYVGRGLTDHPTATLYYLYNGGTDTYLDASLNPAREAENEALYTQTPAQGPLTSAGVAYTSYLRYPGYMTAADKVGDDLVIPEGPNLEITPSQLLREGNPGGCNSKPCTGFQTTITGLQPASRGGTVTLASADPLEKPVIRADFISEEDDIKVLYQGFLTARAAAAQEPLASLAFESYPADLVTDYASFKALMLQDDGQLLGKGTHWHGSCQLGRAVDATLLVKGVANVRVADASVMPRISARPQASVMLVGSIGADIILAAAADADAAAAAEPPP
eukprot:TRINITY_DN2787_c0_g1_i2.p1 TRINITY_DN2787_c0_g1~~TRINITY_DN2787_c0_g1_i2.p1  ORF type:complete len:626 (-),score=211.54 TRINITY_DN2787_c0_g1_i2:572-2449(-)